MTSLDAVTLTGNPQTIKLPLTLPQPSKLLFGNESAYAISIRVGGFQKWVHAWTADILPVPSGVTLLSLTPLLIGSNTNSPSSSALISVADPGEEIPGTYPINLDRLTSLAAGTVNITTGSVSISNNVPVLNATGTQLDARSPQTLLATITLANGSPTVTDVTLPAGTHALNVVFSSGANVTACTFTGKTTGALYLSQNPSSLGASGAWFYAPVSSAADSQITTSFTANAAGVKAYVSAVLDPTAVVVFPNTNALAVSVNNTPSVSVPTPVAWQAPTATGTANTVLVHGTTATLITGVALKQIYVHEIHLSFSAAPPNPINIKESGGTVYRQLAPGGGNSTGPYVWNLKGLPLPVGNSLQIQNGHPATDIGLMCQVDYAQV